MFNKQLFKMILLIIYISYISCKVLENSDYFYIGNNSITINSYKSNLTEDQRTSYYYWIGLRNSFYFSENSNQLEKLVKYFTPEEENYYKDLYNFSAPCLILTGVVIVVLFIYLIKRFLLKGCQGPKIVERSYHHTTYFLIGFGFLLGLIFISCTIYNAGVSK